MEYTLSDIKVLLKNLLGGDLNVRNFKQSK